MFFTRILGVTQNYALLDSQATVTFRRESRKYPELTPEWESSAAEARGLYFLGTLAHSRDNSKLAQSLNRRSSGGFIHGFRYTVRCTFVMWFVWQSLPILKYARHFYSSIQMA